MSYESTNPNGAHELMRGGDSWIFIDVRTEEEFHGGHVPDAYNIPVLFRDPMRGMTPNERFVEIVAATFHTEERLVLGCAAGIRSARACEMLAAAGYVTLVNMSGGFSGGMDAAGRLLEAGWEACGLACETDGAVERLYRSLCQ